MRNIFRNKNKRSLSRSTIKGGLFASVAIISTIPVPYFSAAYAQQASVQTIAFDIRSQNMGGALTAFADRAGLKLLLQSSLVAGKTSQSVRGNFTPEQALSRLLSGSGLTYRIDGTTVTVANPARDFQLAPDALNTTLLDTITVSGGNGVAAAEAPYYTPAPTAYISEQSIERFRGASPADIFRGTAGVMSAEARNGAGSIDVNIRGMQGMGRVKTTIDGAENAINIYQGYQGISNRTFVDPDLLAGIEIQKGSDAASSGIAGTVAMRTVEAGDIVKEGNRFGIRVKGGFGTNSSKPVQNTVAGYEVINRGYAGPQINDPELPDYDSLFVPSVTSSEDTMHRPAFLEPTNGSGSIVTAMKDEQFEFLAGYAYRKRGNYYAGKHGTAAEVIERGPSSVCNTLSCQLYPSDPYNWMWYPQYMEHTGLTNYRAGEQVLNTQLETKSWLVKGKYKFGDGHSIQVGYTGFQSIAADRMASNLNGLGARARQQSGTTDADIHTGTFKYRWKPEENDLINVKSNIWVTRLEQRSPPAYGGNVGAPAGFKSGPDLWTWGADVSNESHLNTRYGELDLTYGASYKLEDTSPSEGTRKWDTWLDLRDGKREEAATYIKAAYKPVDWLTLNGGLRYSYMWSKDRSNPTVILPEMDYSMAAVKEGGFSPSIGVTVEPVKGTQFYTNYSSTLRAPSIMESVTAFSMNVNADTKAERSNNWEIGVNFVEDGLIANTDQAMLKFGYFNWDVQDYIAREWYKDPNKIYPGMRIINIDRAKFSGLELSARYDLGGFSAELAANYYLNVEFCRTSETCEDKSLYADYSTNAIPPKYGIDLTLSQKLLEEALTVGGRVSYVSNRAIGHGDATAQGMSQFIRQIEWEPYALVDLFAEYKLNENYTASVRVENLTDRYYVDPLSLVQQPGPGRTFYASLTASF